MFKNIAYIYFLEIYVNIKKLISLLSTKKEYEIKHTLFRNYCLEGYMIIYRAYIYILKKGTNNVNR